MSEQRPDTEDEILDEETSVDLPRWIDALVVPLVNVVAALLLSAVIILMLGENPFSAMRYLVGGAIGSEEALGYTLFYATSFVFTGLSVALAFHCGLLNLGSEGQAYIGGLGVALVCLAAGNMPTAMVFVMAVGGGVLFGAFWGLIPGYLQGARGSHIVITSIMFNFLAASLVSYVMLTRLIEPGQTATQTRDFAASSWLPKAHEVAAGYGLTIAPSPLNLSLVLAVACAVLVWILIWHTAIGYEIRVVGKDRLAAVYAGISPTRSIVLAMAVSGGLSGLLGVNELMGSQHRLVLDFVGGYGLAGVAVALMGRNHPFGIFLSAFLFGALYQGGAALSFEIPAIPREMVILIQGLVILFSGALAHVFRPHLAMLWQRRHEARDAIAQQRDKLRAARARRRIVATGQRQSNAERKQALANMKATARAKGKSGKDYEAELERMLEPEGEPQVVYDADEALRLSRERGEVEYQKILRRSAGIEGDEDPAAVEATAGPVRKRRRWLPKLPKLPRIRFSVERDD